MDALINRDEDAYPGAEELDWRRPVRHHLAFGFGAHQRIGQNLARTEPGIALRSLFTRLPGLRLACAPEEIPFQPGDTIQELLELPVTYTPVTRIAAGVRE